MRTLNRQVTLISRPLGLPKESDFNLVQSPIPQPAPGQFLVKTHYLSVDPYLRGLMAGGRSYAGSLNLGEVVPAGAVGAILESLHPAFKPGDLVVGHWGWQEHAALSPDSTDVHPFDTSLAPMSTALGVLGMPGMTAYFGLLDIGRPQPGETVFISAAAGAVGSLVGQIGRILGCKVYGSAGSDDKVAWLLNDLHFDGAFNYKGVTNFRAKIRRLCPQGIDVYFDNVGGPVTDGVFPNINTHARIVVCGQIDQYNDTDLTQGPRLLWHLVPKQARAEGFLVFQFRDRFPEAQNQLAQWIKAGKLTWRESVLDGIENTPKAFIGLFTGSNIGKQLVRLVPD